ncbi:hypothetical protein L2449_27355 [Mesorhizobium muleiense]|uniref:hypothetical protein n=1 Tax=Mesorhizobium muleiense TaxID=1004279 RepID=UPI001F173D7D|nr:hypothetical protein [Mesorhizobium muleiense]MCF6120546.1 hypothetical protein [Mesorhizobium muleiense]
MKKHKKFAADVHAKLDVLFRDSWPDPRPETMLAKGRALRVRDALPDTPWQMLLTLEPLLEDDQGHHDPKDTEELKRWAESMGPVLLEELDKLIAAN